MRAGQASFLADNLQIFIEDLLCTHSVLRSVGHIERFCVRQEACVFTEKTRMTHVNKVDTVDSRALLLLLGFVEGVGHSTRIVYLANEHFSKLY